MTKNPNVLESRLLRTHPPTVTFSPVYCSRSRYNALISVSFMIKSLPHRSFFIPLSVRLIDLDRVVFGKPFADAHADHIAAEGIPSHVLIQSVDRFVIAVGIRNIAFRFRIKILL